MRKNITRHFVATPLSDEELQKRLLAIGAMIKALMAKTTMERFSVESSISTAQIDKYRHGGDMYLSSFLRVLYALDISPENFFKLLEQQ